MIIIPTRYKTQQNK